MAGTALRRAAGDERVAAPAPARAAHARLAGLDALRGLALLAMIAYHFCFDLRWFGLARFDFEHDVRWLATRSIILGSFLVIAGASLVLAAQRPDAPRRLAVHVARIAGAALLVSAASYVASGSRYIWFGVLHAIAVALVLAWPVVKHPRIAAVLGAAVIAAGLLFAHPAFDNRALGWIGFMTYRPPTEDYVPLFPWTGVLLLGIPAGHALVRTHGRLLEPLARLPRAIALLGRHSLLVYLVHQPLLVGLLWLVTRIR
jgi:uncharacterized membrane protein